MEGLGEVVQHGGGVVKDKKETIAGGGGSFNTGANLKKGEGLEGDGKVIITLLEADDVWFVL